jgi:hypothetical protein
MVFIGLHFLNWGPVFFPLRWVSAGRDDLVCGCWDSTCGLRMGRSLLTDNAFHQSKLWSLWLDLCLVVLFYQVVSSLHLFPIRFCTLTDHCFTTDRWEVEAALGFHLSPGLRLATDERVPRGAGVSTRGQLPEHNRWRTFAWSVVVHSGTP